MAKLSARGHHVVAQWSRTSEDGQTTWHYALRTDGALLRRVTSKYVPDYGPLGKGASVTDSGHWTIKLRYKWTIDCPQSATLSYLGDQLTAQGYTRKQ